MLPGRHLSGCALPARRLQAAKCPASSVVGPSNNRTLRLSMLPGPRSSPSPSCSPSPMIRPASIVRAASSDSDPSSVSEDPGPSLIDKLVKFWQAAPMNLRVMLVMLPFIMAFITSTPLWAGMSEAVSNAVGHACAPVTNWINENIVDSMKYRMLQVFSLPTTGKLWAVFACGAPVVYMGGWAYKTVSGVEWVDAVAKSYFTLNNVPGMDCTSDDSPMGVIILNCIHILSLFTFAILVGILTDDISSAVEEIQSGNFAVPEANHTVLIGWNKQTVPVLHQIMKIMKNNPDGQVFRCPVIILANRDKGEMDEELLEEFGEDIVGKTILTRKGYALRKLDLERVAAGKARTLLWMHPDAKYLKELGGGEADSDDSEHDKPEKHFLGVTPRLVSSLASIQTLGVDEMEPQNLVFQSRDMMLHKDLAMQVVFKKFKKLDRDYAITEVTDMRSLTEVMAQCASQPGLADVFEELFERSKEFPPEFKLLGLRHMEGWSFGDVRRAYTGRVAVCGTLKEGLNPSDDLILTKDDRVLVLTVDNKNREPLPVKGMIPMPVLHSYESVKRTVRARNYVVVSHSGDPSQLVEALLESLDQEAKVVSTITVLTNDECSYGPSGTKRVRVKYVHGDLTSREVLVKGGIESADSVILHIMSEHSPADADSQTLATVIQLQSLVKQTKDRMHPLGVICCVNDRDTRDVLEHLTGSDTYKGGTNRLHVDCIQPDKLLSGILTQVAACPDLKPVFEDMFDADGNEIYAKPVEHYDGVLPGTSMTWEVVQEVVRAEGDLLIGYVDRCEEVHMAVAPSTKLVLQPGDRLIVFAEDMF